MNQFRRLLDDRRAALGITREQLAWRLRVSLEELNAIEDCRLWLGAHALKMLMAGTGCSRQEILEAASSRYADREGPTRLFVYDEDASALRATAVSFGRKDIPSYFQLVEESIAGLAERYGVNPGEDFPQKFYDDLNAFWANGRKSNSPLPQFVIVR